ncbi:MAG: UDP-2,3-diacylglucosamine diphosphatase LpxI [Kiritimatiellae bacterium]|nr:UDP-2,3-diacylglucosamine diphosphatase LpxI [Kiritimatiellia bacterium]
MTTDGDTTAPGNSLLIIAGRGSYPVECARGAREEGVQRISAIAFRGESNRRIGSYADDVHWMPLGALQRLLDTARELGASNVVLAGQIAPRNLFHLRLDRRARDIMRSMHERHAHSIFGAFVAELEGAGFRVLPAHRFMRPAIPAPGPLSRRTPDERELRDIEYGRRLAKAVGALDIGQTVVVKEGVVLAVEAFEGTDAAIRRGGRLGGQGAVVVKSSKPGHDVRFDMPVIGPRTLCVLRRAGVTALAVEAGRTVILERERSIAEANRRGLAWIAYPGPEPEA